MSPVAEIGIGTEVVIKGSTPYFISGEVKVDVIAQNFEHLKLMELRKHVRDTVMQVEGLPPELQGVIENSNRATIDSAD